MFGQQNTLLDSMHDDFDAMLKNAESLYRKVTDVLFLGSDIEMLKSQISDQDHEINLAEQKIRRRIVTHLSTGTDGVTALNSCLVLMNVVKDVERIGDYAKNIFEVFETTKQLDNTQLLDVRNAILQSFQDVSTAFNDSNEVVARSVLAIIGQKKDTCDMIVEAALKSPTDEHAVAFALLARFFKRTLAHLGNIATSIVMPLDKIDYFDEDIAS